MSYILIAEDDRDILLLVRRKLELSGYTDIWGTPNGALALKKALEARPRLLVLDIMLPGLDGLSICRQVKAHYADHAPPIMLMSARGQQDQVDEGKAAGADEYIIKPFSPRDLLEKVEVLIRK